MVKKYIKDINELGRLPKKIILAHPRGYVGAIVEGGRQEGKTVFCLKSTRQTIQYHHGITRDDAWEMILGVGNYRKEKPHIIFSLNEVNELFDTIDLIDWNDPTRIGEWLEKYTHLIKIWDDAGMHGGKYKYLVAVKQVEFLQGNMDVIRFVLTGFLINSPEIQNLLKFLREYHDHIIIDIRGRRERGSKWGRIAHFQKWKKNKRNIWVLRENPPHTPFSRYLGDVDQWSLKEQWVYDTYELMKAKAIRDNRDEFKKMMKIAKKDEPDKDPYDVIGIPEEYKKLISSD